MSSRFDSGEEKQTDSQEQQYIMFTVAGQKFAVDIMQTREIINMTELTDMPSSPDFIKGVVNLRGEIVPIVDLERRLDVSSLERSAEKNQRIIIVSIDENLVGMQVSRVEGIIRLDADDVGEAPEITRGIHENYIDGVGKLEEELVVILDLAGVLTAAEVEELEEFEPEQGE